MPSRGPVVPCWETIHLTLANGLTARPFPTTVLLFHLTYDTRANFKGLTSYTVLRNAATTGSGRP